MGTKDDGYGWVNLIPDVYMHYHRFVVDNGDGIYLDVAHSYRRECFLHFAAVNFNANDRVV